MRGRRRHTPCPLDANDDECGVCYLAEEATNATPESRRFVADSLPLPRQRAAGGKAQGPPHRHRCVRVEVLPPARRQTRAHNTTPLAGKRKGTREARLPTKILWLRRLRVLRRLLRKCDQFLFFYYFYTQS